jgi:hypothetical protein
LARKHEVEIVIRRDLKGFQDLVEQIAMLSRYRDLYVEAGRLTEKMNGRAKLDCLGSGAEDK